MGLPIINAHAAGVDIGARIQVAAVPPDLCETPVQTFQAFTADIERMADWLVSLGIKTVAMESTGVYWIPVYEILEDRGLVVVLANARECKAVPGRKSDVNDAQWLQRLHACGLLRASFRPARDIAALRTYMRVRDRHLEYAAAHIQHMQKALTHMNLQLHHVVSDVPGVTGMKIVRAIIAGERSADVLAAMRDVRCRESVETIRAAMVGNYQPEHVFALEQAMASYDSYQDRIAECDEQIQKSLELLAGDKDPPAEPLGAPRSRTKQTIALKFDVRPLLHQLTGIDLTQIHGIGPSVALALIAECGTDLGRWPTEKHFTSWLTLSPGCKISGGKVLSSHTRNVTAEVLEARHELDRLSKELRRKEGELKALQATSESWRREAQAWLRQAVELGLYAAKAAIPEAWPETLDALRGVLEAEPQAFGQSVEGIETVLTRLADLRDQEVKLTAELRQHRDRLNELKALSESGEDYVHSLRVQRDRLSLSSWIRERYWQGAAAKAVDGDGQEKVEALCQALESLEVQLRSFPVASETLSRETLRERAATQRTLDALNLVRREVQSLETRSEAVRQMTSQSEQVQRFLGRLEEVLRVYDAADASSELRGDVEELRRRVKALTDQVREFEIRRRMDLALAQVHGNASKMLPLLDGEWSDAPIRLMVQDLTIKVIRGNREDYLWEVGSGANWLAYHVSVTLALQKFFLTSPNHPVPSMLVYDQPSQVYFPARRSSATEQSTKPTRWFDEDIVAVRKVFSLLASEAYAANGRLQIVVLDHADSEVWGTVSGIHLVEEWRGEALVPQAWLQP